MTPLYEKKSSAPTIALLEQSNQCNAELRGLYGFEKPSDIHAIMPKQGKRIKQEDESRMTSTELVGLAQN